MKNMLKDNFPAILLGSALIAATGLWFIPVLKNPYLIFFVGILIGIGIRDFISRLKKD